MLHSNGIFAIAMLAATSAAAAGSVSPELRQKAETVCFEDASRLCPEALTDEGQVVACMRGKRTLLTASCRTVYDQVVQSLK